jgi:hypothetical protein
VESQTHDPKFLETKHLELCKKAKYLSAICKPEVACEYNIGLPYVYLDPSPACCHVLPRRSKAVAAEMKTRRNIIILGGVFC